MVQFLPLARVHGSRDQEVEKGIIPLSITPSDPLGKNLFPVPVTLNSADLQVLVPHIPLYWKFSFPLVTLCF